MHRKGYYPLHSFWQSETFLVVRKKDQETCVHKKCANITFQMHVYEKYNQANHQYVQS